MTTIPRQEVVATAYMLDRLQKEATKKARNSVKKWIKANPNWEAADLRNYCIALVNKLVSEYGIASSSLACDLYDGIMGGEFAPAEPWSGDLSDKVARSVRYQLKKALNGDIDAYLKAIDEMTAYYVKQYANETTMANCERDSRLYSPSGMGEGLGQAHNAFALPSNGRPGAYRSNMRRNSRGETLSFGVPAFARVPTGLETCTYCVMLASRGFVYRSADSAGHADHRGCNCLIVPGRYGDVVEGVDTAAQYDCWRELEALEAWKAKNPDKMDTAELERRKQEIVNGYGDSLAISIEPGEVRKLASTLRNYDGYRLGGWYTPRARMADNYQD